MKKTKLAITMLLLLGVILSFYQEAIGALGTEVSIGSIPLTINPNASGTKLSGPLTIYYEMVAGNPLGCFMDTRNMHFFIRLRKGSTLSGFSGKGGGNVCLENVNGQEQIIMNFIATKVMPTLFPDKPYATFALKSVDQIVEDDGNGSPVFYILDIEIAVKD